MGRLILLFILLVPLPSLAEIYRWTDANGQIHFGEQPGAGAERVEVKPQVVEREAATRESQERLRKVLDAHQQEKDAVAQKQAGITAERSAKCNELRKALARLQQGGSFYSETATGERSYFSDQQIEGARSKLSVEIAANCQ